MPNKSTKPAKEIRPKSSEKNKTAKPEKIANKGGFAAPHTEKGDTNH
jgi:hypothetical protein